MAHRGPPLESPLTVKRQRAVIAPQFFSFAVALMSLLKTEHFHITVVVWGPFESTALAQYTCCWVPLKIEYFHITVAIADHC